ncbi:MAG: SBBP repeat-containing protein, partial [Bryobacteraceae bacterium]
MKATPHFARIRYRELYPGVDLLFYGNRRRLEFDFVVRPGADPSAIRLRFRGVEDLSLDSGGQLRLRTPGGDLWQPRPVCYQEYAGKRVRVQAEYKLIGQHEVGFALAQYDRGKELVIDPLLVWLTYYGGTGLDAATAIALDSHGNVLVAGYTESPMLPAAGGASIQAPAAELPRHGFILKLTGDGKNVLSATYLDGNRNDEIHALTLDLAGNIYVAWRTDWTNFPVSANAFQSRPRSSRLWGEAFVAKLNAAGGLIYATYLGGNELDQVLGIAVDSVGRAYVAGETFSDDFSTTAGALRRTPCAGFNTDAFVAKLNADGSALEYSTLVCGALADRALAIAMDSAGNAYVAGETTSADFPVTARVPQAAQRSAYEDAFVFK